MKNKKEKFKETGNVYTTRNSFGFAKGSMNLKQIETVKKKTLHFATIYTNKVLNKDEFASLSINNEQLFIADLKQVVDKKADKTFFRYTILTTGLNIEKQEFLACNKKDSVYIFNETNTQVEIVHRLKHIFKDKKVTAEKLTKDQKTEAVNAWLNDIKSIQQMINDSSIRVNESSTLQKQLMQLESKVAKSLSLTSQMYDKMEMSEINKEKTNEYILSIMKTDLATSVRCIGMVTHLCESSEQQIAEYDQSLEDKLYTLIVSDDMDINILINLLISDKYEGIFLYYSTLYNMISTNGILNFEKEKHIKQMFRCEINCENQLMINEQNKTMWIVFNNEMIFFEFTDIIVENNSSFTPGLSVIKDFKNNCKILREPINQEKDIEQEISDYVFDTSAKYQELMFICCSARMGISVESYKQILSRENRNIYVDNDGKYRIMSTNLFEYQVGKINYSQNASSFYKIPMDSELTTDVIWFTSFEIHDKLNSLSEKNQCFKCLYETMIDHHKQKLVSFDKEQEHLQEYKIPIIVPENELIVEFKEGNHYGFDNLSKEDYLKKFGDMTRYDAYQSCKIKTIELLTKMKTTQLKRLEIYEASFPYRFINKKAFQISNFDTRAALELLNIEKDKERKDNMIDLFIKRVGDYSTLLCSIYHFSFGVTVNNGGYNLMKEIKWSCVETKYWVSFFGKLSLAVKTSRYVNGYRIEFRDFKNLQYIESFIGQLGYDAKTPKEIAKDRMYQQVKKKTLFWGHDAMTDDQVLGADIICKNLFKLYWTKVFDQTFSKNKNYKYPGIISMINNRAAFSTTSSSGGFKSGYNDINFLTKKFGMTKDYVENYVKGETNKLSAFLSESDLWFQRVLFDMPITISNMVPKPKEFAKTRYIFGVLSMHYMFNSLATFEFEKNMNHLGILQVTDDTGDFYHNYERGHSGNIYNCIDYSVFNDQHEKRHKQMIWSSYREVAKDFFPESTWNEINLVSIWMEQSCELMWLRFTGDRTVMIRHEGRLFSGERSTTFVNSMMSIFYLYLVNRNLFDYIYWIKNKEPRFKNYHCELENKILGVVNDNRTLGDDSITKMNSDIYAKLMNEMALFTGLVLKTEKCMIGHNVSEFLRKIDFKQNKKNIKKGYVNRSIVSFIAGNLEGSIERDWIGRINQIYEQISTIVQRTGDVIFFERVFEHLSKLISRINRKYKDKSSQTMPIEWLYTPKKYNGLGLLKLSTKQVYIPKTGFKKNRKQLNKFLIKYGKVDLTLYNSKIKPNLYSLVRFGRPNWRAHRQEILRNYQSIIASNSVMSTLYSDEYIDEQVNVCAHANNIVMMKGTWINQIIYNENVQKVYQLIKEFFNEGNVLYKGIVGKFKLIDMIERNYQFIITKYSIKEIIKLIGGQTLIDLYNYKIDAEKYNVIPEYIENGIMTEIIAPIFLIDNKSKFTVQEKLSGLRLYFENEFSKM